LVPFDAAIKVKLPAIMISNAAVPGLFTRPTSLSHRVIIGELRNKLPFDGLVLIDSLTALSISKTAYSLPRATVSALEAGAEMVLFNVDGSLCNPTTQQIITGVIQAVVSGHLTCTQRGSVAVAGMASKHVASCGIVA
jgi:beta-N-acetylhexosaminidase